MTPPSRSAPSPCSAATTSALLSQLAVSEISGIAGRRAERLAPYGIRTCLDLADADGRLVKKLLTKTGYELWLELNGHPVAPIRPERSPHKALARGGSLMGSVTDPAVLWAWVVRHLERLIEELRFHVVRTDALGVQVAWADGESTGGVCKLPCASDRFDELLDAARVALRRAYVPHGTATHLHVVAPELRRAKGFQLSLFDEPDPRREAVAAVKAAVNERFGRFKLRSGTTLFLPKVYGDPANDFDICDVRGNPSWPGRTSKSSSRWSSHAFTAWRYGHKWVVLAVLVKFPFATRPWALPVLVDLYRSEADNRARNRPHRTPAQLMCRLLRLVLIRFPDRTFVFVGDSGYGTHAVARFCRRHRSRLTLVSERHPRRQPVRPATAVCR